MNKIAALLVFATVTGGMYFVCANAHIDVFPCEQAQRERPSANAPHAMPRLVTRASECSLMAHQRGTNGNGEYERLTPTGWAILWALCGGIGLAAGLAVGALTRKRR